jgi:hypothetical protein
VLYSAGMMKDHGKALGSVAVLSSYKAQVKALRSQFERMHGTATMAAVEFATIDGFQVTDSNCSNTPLFRAASKVLLQSQ